MRPTVVLLFPLLFTFLSPLDTTPATDAKQCTYIRLWNIVGGDLPSMPLYDLESAAECCQRCIDFKGPGKTPNCTAFSFVWILPQTECWLKFEEGFNVLSFGTVSGHVQDEDYT